MGARQGEQIYRKAFIWEDVQRYLGSGLLVCGADGEEESWLSGLSLGVDKGTVTELESSEGETSLGEILGLLPACLCPRAGNRWE